MRSSILINTNDSENITFSLVIEEMPVKNLKSLKKLGRLVAESFVNTLEFQGGNEYTDEQRTALIQNLLGIE